MGKLGNNRSYFLCRFVACFFASSSAEEQIAAIGLEPRHGYSRPHLEPLQDLSGSRIDSPQIALVTFQGGVPQLSINPGDPGDEALGLDGLVLKRRWSQEPVVFLLGDVKILCYGSAGKSTKRKRSGSKSGSDFYYGPPREGLGVYCTV